MCTPELPASRRHNLESPLAENRTPSAPPAAAERLMPSEVDVNDFALPVLPGRAACTAEIGSVDSTTPLNCWPALPATRRTCHCSLLTRVMSTPLSGDALFAIAQGKRQLRVRSINRGDVIGRAPYKCVMDSTR